MSVLSYHPMSGIFYQLLSLNWKRSQEKKSFIDKSLLHINELELKAIYFAVKAFPSLMEGKNVKVESDNSTAACSINAMGGTKSPSCNDITNLIWSWCITKNIWLTATHITVFYYSDDGSCNC